MNERRTNHDKAGGQDDPLTRLLRDGDPAAGDAGLDPVELAGMRQLVTKSAGRSASDGLWSPDWRAWMKPALAAAAVAVVATGLWMLGGGSLTEPLEVADTGPAATELAPTAPAPDTETVPDSTPITSDPVVEAVPGPSDPADLVTGLAPETPGTASADEPDTAIATAPTTENATTAAVDAASPTDKQARTVRFTAPRGTRIIWTLDPNFESPIAGQEARQEQAR